MLDYNILRQRLYFGLKDGYQFLYNIDPQHGERLYNSSIKMSFA